MTKADVLLFDTEFSALYKTVRIKDGKVVIGNKEFIVDKVRPFTLNKPFGGVRPLYILKWNSVVPMSWEVKEKKHTFVETKENGSVGEKHTAITKDIVPAETTFMETKILPEALRSTADMRFLKGMKLGAQKEKKDIGAMLPYIIAFGAAALIMVILLATGVLPKFLETFLGIKIA